MRSNKFVLDTNVWISYFISKNYDTISIAVNKRKAIIPVCLELFAELERVLQYPHLSKLGINTKDALRFVKDMGTFYTIQQPIKNYIPGDADDNYIIALALQTNAGFVTSGDDHILDQKETLEKKFTKLKIITKVEFEDLVK